MIFGIAQAAVLKTESFTASLAGAAGQVDDLVSNAAAWKANIKSSKHLIDENVSCHRCLDNLRCTGLRLCSQ